MTFVELTVVPIYWYFPGTIKGYCLSITDLELTYKTYKTTGYLVKK